MKKVLVLSFTLLILLGCKQETKKVPLLENETVSIDSTTRTEGYNEFRNPYFGQTHQHTGWSFDEAIYNVRLGPDNTYRHARGEKVLHPSGFEVQLKLPLDFMVVSDHAEYLGVLLKMYDPNNPLSKHPLAKDIVGSGDDVELSTKAFYNLVSQTIQGSYSGSFSHGIPSFPFGYQGPSFNQNKGPKQGFAEFAWIDGYVYVYRNSIVQSFEFNIKNICTKERQT